MNFPQRLSYEKWLGIGRQLAAASTSAAWCLGDWLIHGENAYSGRYRDALERTSLDYQTLRNYAWVARRFTLSRRRDTLSFAHHAEVAGLPEPEQDFWLRKAEELSWSRNRLRQELRASLAERATGDDQSPVRPCSDGRTPATEDRPRGVTAEPSLTTEPSLTSEPPLTTEPSLTTEPPSSLTTEPAPSLETETADARIQVQLSPEQLESCRAAADTLGRRVEEWAAFALDQAAREQLSRRTADDRS